MTGFSLLLGELGYFLAAALFGAFAIWTSRRQHDGAAKMPVIVAQALTALWALDIALGMSLGFAGLSGGVAETMRNAAWLAVIWVLLRENLPAEKLLPPGAQPVVLALMLALLCQLALDLFAGRSLPLTDNFLPLYQASWLLRATVAAGAIFLLHILFARRARDGVGQVGWLGCALTIMWAYDFNHYLLTWFSDGDPLAIGHLRGLVMAAIAPLIVLGTGTEERHRFALSRRAAFHVVTIATAALYLLALLAMLLLVRTVDNPAARIVQLGAVFALAVIALVLLPSAPFRAWLRVEIAKHLFAHRYDYRAEWMRFAEAIASESEDGELLPLRRAARAVATAVSAPAALLLLRRPGGELAAAGDWHWTAAEPATGAIPADVAVLLERTGWIVAVARADDPHAARLPAWIREDVRAWALVPLIHAGELMGAVLVARPDRRGDLDWEDLDMFRVLASQLAVTLSDRRHQEALAEAQRFDEFNRRFAFILHDIKNLVSQISLLAGNAERHADNPAFRADMVLTLRETADRMNGLVARLARPDQPQPAQQQACDLAEVVRAVAGNGGARGRVIVTGEGTLPVRADPLRLRQAIGHLVQNALEATPPDGPPVRLVLARMGGMACLDIIDQGCGMSAEFIATGLFRPFTSTKATGFGLGAHEARALVTALAGRLDVESRPGEGSRFTISLPLLDENGAGRALSLAPPPSERKTG